MDILEFNRRFMRIEEELGLFPHTGSAEPVWWDVVRHDVMKLAYDRMQGIPAEPVAAIKFSTRLLHLAHRTLLRVGLAIRLRLGRYDVMAWRAPRLLKEGRRIDTGLDQVLAACPGRKLVVNTFPHRYDRAFARAHQLAARPDGLGALEARIHQEYGIDLDLDQFVRRRLADFDIGLRHYAELIAKARPRLLLVNQNGIEKALFRAAREAALPCVEVQHGLINGAHPAYDYPRSVGGGGLSMFPTVLFTFSQFWIDGCHYPARHCIAVGNDAFCSTALPPPPDNGSVLVISAPKYHEALLRWIRAAAPRLAKRHFVYKLHPSQATMLQAIRAEMTNLPNVSVRSTDVTVHALLADVSDVLLIQSTVAYEAVQAGRRLVIIPELDYGAHSDLMMLDNVDVVAHVDALVARLCQPARNGTTRVFFEPFNSALASRVLTELLANGELSPAIAGPLESGAP